MATRTQKRGTTAAKTKAAKAAKPAKAPVSRKIETPDKAAFDVDDKRAQYARLVVFNYAVKQKKAGKDSDVNSVSDSILEAAGKELANGNMLAGAGGIELIITHSKAGATDANVAKRGLTPAYAAEVRPFIRRLKFAPSFSRRTPPKKAAKAESGS